MFGRLHVLLAVACVAVVCSEGQADCVTANWGYKTDSEHEVPSAVIEKGDTDAVVNLPFTSVVRCKVVGVTATICNPDVGGSLSFESQFTIHVHRPSAEEEGVVSSVAYCDPLRRVLRLRATPSEHISWLHRTRR